MPGTPRARSTARAFSARSPRRRSTLMRSCQSTIAVPKVSRSAIFTIGALFRVDDRVVAEELEEPVLPREEPKRLVPGVDVLVDGVLRYVHDVALRELPASWLCRDARVVTVRDLGRDLPLQRVAATGFHVEDFVGHMPVPRCSAADRDLELREVDASEPHVGLPSRRDDAQVTVARVLPARRRLLHDLALLLHAGRPEARPVDARAEARRAELGAAALLPQPEVHPERLRLENDPAGGMLRVRVEMLVDAVRVDDDRVAALPVVAHAVVDLVAAAVEDVVERLVLMTVSFVLAARGEVDGVHLEALREERIVPGTDEPLRARARAQPGIPRHPVREDRAGAGLAHARRRVLPRAMLGEPVGLGRDAAQENAFAHRAASPKPKGRMVRPTRPGGHRRSPRRAGRLYVPYADEGAARPRRDRAARRRGRDGVPPAASRHRPWDRRERPASPCDRLARAPWTGGGGLRPRDPHGDGPLRERRRRRGARARLRLRRRPGRRERARGRARRGDRRRGGAPRARARRGLGGGGPQFTDAAALLGPHDGGLGERGLAERAASR